jgi:hypothetical protein
MKQYLKELRSFITFRVKTNSKISHSRKRNKIMKMGIFGGYERVNETEFDLNSKIGKN